MTTRGAYQSENSVLSPWRFVWWWLKGYLGRMIVVGSKEWVEYAVSGLFKARLTRRPSTCSGIVLNAIVLSHSLNNRQLSNNLFYWPPHLISVRHLVSIEEFLLEGQWAWESDVRVVVEKKERHHRNLTTIKKEQNKLLKVGTHSCLV